MNRLDENIKVQDCLKNNLKTFGRIVSSWTKLL